MKKIILAFFATCLWMGSAWAGPPCSVLVNSRIDAAEHMIKFADIIHTNDLCTTYLFLDDAGSQYSHTRLVVCVDGNRSYTDVDIVDVNGHWIRNEKRYSDTSASYFVGLSQFNLDREAGPNGDTDTVIANTICVELK